MGAHGTAGKRAGIKKERMALKKSTRHAVESAIDLAKNSRGKTWVQAIAEAEGPELSYDELQKINEEFRVELEKIEMWHDEDRKRGELLAAEDPGEEKLWDDHERANFEWEALCDESDIDTPFPNQLEALTKSETNPRAAKLSKHRTDMNNARACTICPPHGGENANRGGKIRKHGNQKKRKRWKREAVA